MFLPGESQGQASLVGCRLWGRTESDTTEATQQQQQQQQPWLLIHGLISASCAGQKDELVGLWVSICSGSPQTGLLDEQH